MPDQRITIEAEEAPPAPPPPSDRVLELAERVGAMSAREQSRDQELSQVRAGLTQACDRIQNLELENQSLRSQASRAQEQAESAQAVAAATAVELQESSEERGAVLDVTPPMETRIEIEQKPATARGWLSKAIFGP